MPRPLSNDLRERIIKAIEGGMSRNAAAKKFDIAPSSAVKIMALWNKTGSYKPKKIGGNRPHILAEHLDKVELIINEKSDITLTEIQTELATKDIKVCISTIAKFLNYIGFSYKKNGLRQRTRSK